MENFYAAMENTLAQMIFYLNENQLTTDNGLMYLFAETDDIKASIDDTLRADTRQDLCSQLTDMQEKQAKQGRSAFLFTMSPSYRLFDTVEAADGGISCDVYMYENFHSKNNPKDTCQLRMMRLDISFIRQKGLAKICEFHLFTIQTMKAWDFDADRNGASITPFINTAFCEKPEQTAAAILAYAEVKKLVNMLWDHLMYQTEHLFSDNNVYEKLKQYFRSDHTSQPSIGLTASPQIFKDENGVMKVLSPVEVFKLKSSSEVERTFHYIWLCISCENGLWKIQDAQMLPIFTLPLLPYISGRRYDKISNDILPWTLYNTATPYMYPEDAYEIENILSQWIYSARRGKLWPFYRKYMKNDSFVPKMMMKSYGDQSPVHVGKSGIQKKLADLESHYIPGMYSYHMATTPVIQFSEDGKTAWGAWFDHSATSLYDDAICKDHIPYMVFVGRYMHEFKKIQNQWYMTSFFSEPLLSMADWELDVPASEGWVKSRKGEHYPKLFASLS